MKALNLARIVMAQNLIPSRMRSEMAYALTAMAAGVTCGLIFYQTRTTIVSIATVQGSAKHAAERE